MDYNNEPNAMADLNNVFQNEAVRDFAKDAVMGAVNQQWEKLSIFSLAYYKYYFAVDNSYVLNKMKLILLPFLNHNWERKMKRMNDSTQFCTPMEDVNAPDGYIPGMALVTYILVASVHVGIHESSSFSPEILIGQFSTVSGNCSICVFVTQRFKLQGGFW